MSEQSKSLISLVDESMKIEKALVESGGELTPEIEAMLSEIDVKLPEKVENYALLMDRMEALASFYADRTALLFKLSKAANAVIEKCEANLKAAMMKLESDEILGVDCRFKLQNTSGTVVIDDDSEVDPSYTTVETRVSIDKKRIKEDLKLGVPVRGARLESGKSLRRYANTPGRK